MGHFRFGDGFLFKGDYVMGGAFHLAAPLPGLSLGVPLDEVVAHGIHDTER